MSKDKLVVLDFDDTLFFTGGSVRKAINELLGRSDLSKAQVRKLPKKEKGRIYELAYSKYKHYSKPNLRLIKYITTAKKGYRIIVLTARGRNLHNDTLGLVKEQNIKIQGFYSRSDVTGNDEEWKLERLKGYVKKYSLVELYEDKKDNIEYIKDRINSSKIKFYLVTKRTIRPF